VVVARGDDGGNGFPELGGTRIHFFAIPVLGGEGEKEAGKEE